MEDIVTCVSYLVHERPSDGVSPPRQVSVTSSLSTQTGMGGKGAGDNTEEYCCCVHLVTVVERSSVAGKKTGSLVGLGVSSVIHVFCFHSISHVRHLWVVLDYCMM